MKIGLANILNFIRNFDYPIQAVQEISREGGIGYYVDFTDALKVPPFTNIVFDENNLPMYDYSNYSPPNNIGRQYSSILMGWYAIICLENYLKTKESSHRENFFRQVEWFKNNWRSHRNGSCVWVNNYDWFDHTTLIKSPWISCMAQGLAISVLTRAYKLSKDDNLLDLARRAAKVFQWDIEDGGVRFMEKGYVYYEMYPTKPYSKILDGFIFGLFGLYDLYLITKDEEVLKLFNEGVRTIKDNLDYWNFFDIWSYFGRHRYLCWSMYHKLNYCMIEVLGKIIEDRRLLITAKNWNTFRLNILKKLVILIIFLISVRLIYMKAFFKNKLRSNLYN
jgi:hypothetical protein